MKSQKLCPRCGTPMLDMLKTHDPITDTVNVDWHCPTHGLQLTVSTNLSDRTFTASSGHDHNR